MSEIKPEDLSTLTRAGRSAMSLKEIRAFSRDLAARPLDRLLTDLPGLFALSDSKFHVIANVLAKRMRQPDERDVLVARLIELSAIHEGEVAQRSEELLHSVTV